MGCCLRRRREVYRLKPVISPVKQEKLDADSVMKTTREEKLRSDVKLIPGNSVVEQILRRN